MRLSAEVEVVLHFAAAEALRREQSLTPDHLMYGLLFDAETAATLRAAGADVARLKEAFARALDRPEGPIASAARRLSEAARRLVRRDASAQPVVRRTRETTCAMQRAASRAASLRKPELTGLDVTLGLLFDWGSSPTRLLESAGVTRAALIAAVSTGPPAAEPSRPAPYGRAPRTGYRVVFHNDETTTLELVAELLRAHFGMTESEAAFTMLTVHRKGWGVAGIYAREVAQAKAEQVAAVARERGYPLRVTADPE